MGNKNITEFPHVLNTCVSSFQHTFKIFAGCPMTDRQEKKTSPTKPRVISTMVMFFFFIEIFRISICKTLPLNLWKF